MDSSLEAQGRLQKACREQRRAQGSASSSGVFWALARLPNLVLANDAVGLYIQLTGRWVAVGRRTGYGRRVGPGLKIGLRESSEDSILLRFLNRHRWSHWSQELALSQSGHLGSWCPKTREASQSREEKQILGLALPTPTAAEAKATPLKGTPLGTGSWTGLP